jgi:hypothetical protein
MIVHQSIVFYADESIQSFSVSFLETIRNNISLLYILLLLFLNVVWNRVIVAISNNHKNIVPILIIVVIDYLPTTDSFN